MILSIENFIFLKIEGVNRILFGDALCYLFRTIYQRKFLSIIALFVIRPEELSLPFIKLSECFFFQA